ncbi:metalloregulator ArsR/SmtB family transcription factor [Rhizobium sp.]|uniref:ArsR/SmtB family transcription factor n=1 Tax=Rhizobium sp. TaxID=391 RepID=UPI00289D63E2
MNNAQLSYHADLLSILAHAGRLKILGLLREKEWDVSTLAREVRMSQSALSQHLKKMRDLKVVTTRREAQTVYYSCDHNGVANVMRALRSIYASDTTDTAV